MRPGSHSATPYLRPGIAAGLAGAVTIDAYLLLTIVAGMRSVTFAQFYRHVASGVLGSAAYTLPLAVPLGIALHLAISTVWGIGYAYAGSRTPQVRARPLVSGIVFGVVVMVAMQLVEVAANIYRLPSAAALANSFVAHVAFFGIPVAYVASRFLPSSAATA